jgi:hypothetical protein
MAATDADIKTFLALSGKPALSDAQFVKLQNWTKAMEGWTTGAVDADGDPIPEPDADTIVDLLYGDLTAKIQHWYTDQQAAAF